MLRSRLVSSLAGLGIAWLASAVSAVDPSMAKGVDQSPIDVEVAVAFPKLQFDRPVVVTHAGDGTDRLFVCGQKGTIFVMPNDPAVEEPTVFLEMTDKVAYDDRMNEEGLLGMAFHPKFKENGIFFLYYTSKAEAHLSVISRFRANKERTKADVSTEEVLMTIKQPFWNHNGGTIEFGKDGHLYIALGDGGKGDDPLQSGQDLTTVLGKILRIDIDHPYGIPQDNPFVKTPGARGEIYAYGVRNPWRISFDRQTGALWCADVGQNLWEEISIVPKGGNCGWSKREATHLARVGAKEFIENDIAPKSPDFVDPIWEYPHTDAWGKSITGGQVYRGSKLPKLTGYYLYGDYVSGRLWALKADKAGKVTENRVIAWPSALPIVTFGEDEKGEVFFSSTTGGRIYTFKTK
jgi:glucose/arabinose dehydrogenase